MISDILGALAGVTVIVYSFKLEDKALFEMPLIFGLISVAFERNLFMKILQVILLIWMILVDRHLLILHPADTLAKANTLWWLGFAYAFLNFPDGPKYLGKIITKISDGWEGIRNKFGEMDPT